MKDQCPFCNSKNTAHAFASKNGFLALYNHAPVLPGHSLIIPEKHLNSLYELSEEEITNLFIFARTITSFLAHVYGADAYDWSLQEGEAAGQSIKHLHLHIIPRKNGDLPDGVEWFVKLQQQNAMAIEDPDRRILNDKEYHAISQSLKEKYETFSVPE